MQEEINKYPRWDFPFENVSIKRWIISLIVLFSSFFVLTEGPKISNIFTQYPCRTLLGCVIFQFASLFILDRHPFRKLYKRLRFKDISIIIFTIILATFFSIITAVGHRDLVNNPITNVINSDTIKVIVAIMAIQLMAEEIMFVVPFLFIYNVLKNRTSHKTSVFIALIISSVIFGALHLETYSFNIYQAIVIIGCVRIGLSTGYILTRNLWVSYIAHLIYDMISVFIIYYMVKNGMSLPFL